MALQKPNFVAAPNVKILINIGATLDIATGFYVKGLHNESILNGGLGICTGVVGIGNNFKSTILDYMMLSAADRIMSMTETNINTYDTEINIHEDRKRMFTQRFPTFKKMDILQDGTWVITDKTIYYANEMFEIMKEYLKNKRKSAKSIEVPTPFPDRTGVQPMMILAPTFQAIDSFTEFETEDVAKIQDENELGDSGGNTVHMRSGLAKTRFLMELPTLTGGSYHFTLLTAHIGKEIQMASGPMPQAPVKKLQYLKNGDKVKGVTDKFFFLMSNCFQAYNAAPYINQGTKGPEFPRNSEDNTKLDTDLNIVSLRQLRSKSGPSGVVFELIVSQSEGVLPELTEFHLIRENSYYGLSGGNQNYSLDLLPDVKLSRTSVRSKLDNNETLRRAMNITSEMCQMKLLWRTMEEDLICTPKQLYDDLIQKGYDWSVLLATRGWWTVYNDQHPIPFLSTMDLLRMRLPDDHPNHYHPYWLEADKKTRKPGFHGI